MTYSSEDRMNERRIVNGIQIKFHGNSHPCPLCGESNAKVGDSNDIICWACQKRYCYSCKKMVKRYGPACDTCQ